MVTTTVVESPGGTERVNVVIRLLGEVGTVVDGQRVTVLASPRMTLLVARLVLDR